MEVDEESDQKSNFYPHWLAAHAHLKNEFMEDEKYHILMTWLKWLLAHLSQRLIGELIRVIQ